MSPIEQYRVSHLTRQLASRGVPAVAITAINASADDWCFRVVAGEREFVIRFNHRDLLRVQESTPGAEQQFAFADTRGVCTSAEAEALAVRALADAIVRPGRIPREPAVL